jgi:hypothetical protein
MPVENLPVISAFYDVQRFTQFGSQDLANFYQVQGLATKGQNALYPTMGRRSVNVLGVNRLVFSSEPRAIFRSINYMYVFIGAQVYQIDRYFDVRVLTNPAFDRVTGEIWFDSLVAGDLVFCMFSADTEAGRKLFVIQEIANAPVMTLVTDNNAPPNPRFVTAFGNRFVVSVGDSQQFFLSVIGAGGNSYNPATVFQASPNNASLFASASGKIGQMATLHNQLFIFNDFTTDIWSNVPSAVFDVTFPWKLNTSYNFDYGIADPYSLDVDFGMMCWLAKNKNGLVAFMMSTGQNPQPISTQAVNVWIQRSQDVDSLGQFSSQRANGFLYQWENSVFYRVSTGDYIDYGDLDVASNALSLEYNFSAETWHRCIELNGERNRIQRHVFFNNRHLVTVQDEGAIYEMRGDIYHNEVRNTEQQNIQAPDAFIRLPMRYELVTRQIYQPDYSEFITDYVEIDFVFGDKTFYKSNAPFLDTTFIIDEQSPPGAPIYIVDETSEPGNEVFLVTQDGNTPSFDDNHYNQLFRPYIALLFSDDGGVTFHTADLREFSQLGQYRWRMRWYELGPSRNRVYKLVCVSSAPIVILGAVQSIRRASGGAN